MNSIFQIDNLTTGKQYLFEDNNMLGANISAVVGEYDIHTSTPYCSGEAWLDAMRSGCGIKLGIQDE